MKIASSRRSSSATRRPHFGGRYFIFLKLTTDDGIEGVGEVYAATFGPHVVAQMIEDVCDRHVIGADPFRIERLWRDVYGRGYSGGPTSRSSACSAGSRWRAGTSSARRSSKPVYELLGGRRARAAARLHLPLPGARRRDRTSTSTPISPPSAPRSTSRSGFTALKFDPAGGYSTFDPRQPGLDELERSRALRAAGARGGRRPLRPALRHARPVHAGGRDPARASGSSRTTRSGSRSRPRPRCPRRWRGSRGRPRSRSRRASG